MEENSNSILRYIYSGRYPYIWITIIFITISLFAIRCNKISYSEELKKIIDNNKKTIDEIQILREKELQEYQNNINKLQNDLQEAEKKYNSKIIVIENKKEEKIKYIVEKYSNDNLGLVKEFCAITQLKCE